MNNRHFWEQHGRLAGLLVAFAALLLIVWVLRSAILPFAVGLIIAYLVLPMVEWIPARLPWRGRFMGGKRVISIILTFAAILTLGGFFGVYIISAVVAALAEITAKAPTLIIRSIETLRLWTEDLLLLVPEEYRGEIYTGAQEAGLALLEATRNLLLDAVLKIPATIGLIFGMAVLPFFLFYLLKDWHLLWDRFYGMLPISAREHTRNILSIIRQVLGGYIRAQAVLGLSVGIMVYIGLLIIGVPFAPALAGVAVIGEFIPVAGPWVSAAIAVIIALATVPEKAVWVIILYIAANGIENALLRPKIEGSYLRLHPALVILLLILGSYLAGFWGLLLIVPLTATFVRIVRYIRSAIEAEERNEDSVSV